jgi:aspartyl-tRNA(Asn)/glutamyl-tRNA(Gln) amidotransferase subunit A
MIMDSGESSPVESTTGRRTVLKAAAALAAVGASPTLAAGVAMAKGDEQLAWTPAWRIRDMVAGGQITASSVAEYFIARIEKIDPILHAFRKFDADGARRQAKALDELVAKGGQVGPLAGVPVAIKDNIAVEGMPVFVGSPYDPSSGRIETATRDAVVVERLRAAGAIILGVTVMPGMGIGVGMPDLARHPRNPWDPRRVPGTSSAGGAAAVASGMAPVAIGTDGGGSCRLPAALTGIIGVHSTIGRVPSNNLGRPGLGPLTNSISPIVRDVRDAATVMQVIVGADGRDMLSTMHAPAPDYLGSLSAGAAGLKTAWTPDYGFTRTLGTAETERVIAAVAGAAAKVTKVGASFTPIDETWETFWPHYLVTTAAYSPSGTPNSPATPALLESFEVRARNRKRFDDVLSRFDVLMSPTVQFTAPTVEEWHQSWREMRKFIPIYTSDTFMFNWIGLPAISIPVGFMNGLPLGLQLVGRPDSEPLLFRLAHAYLERFPRPERPPAFEA